VHSRCAKGASCPIEAALTRNLEAQVDDDSFMRADGAQVPVAYSLVSFESDGDIEGAVLLVRDMSEHARAVEPLARMAAIVATTTDAVYTMTPAGLITRWNKGAENLYGYKAEEALGRPVDLLMPPDAVGEQRLIMDVLTREGRPITFETRRRHKSGATLDVSMSMSPQRDATGVIEGAVVVARGVGPRKREEKMLRGILEAAPLAMLATDERGRILFANTQAERLFGYAEGELTWRSVEDLVPPAHAGSTRSTARATRPRRARGPWAPAWS